MRPPRGEIRLHFYKGSTYIGHQPLKDISDEKGVLHYSKKGDIFSVHVCRDCGLRFSKKDYHDLNLIHREPSQKSSGWPINRSVDIVSRRQISRTLARGTTLTTIPPPETAQREGTEQPTDFKGSIIEHAWWMQKQGYKESTIQGRIRILKTLVKRGVNLLDPESVKEVIARQSCSDGRKELLVETYSCFLKMKGGKWNPPKYIRTPRLPWIPTEKEIDQLIAAASNRMGTFLLVLKQTAIRPGEALNLKWTDYDLLQKILSITPEKNSNPRIFKLAPDLAQRIENLPRTSEKIFGNVQQEHFRNNFSLQRKQIAQKLGKPRLKNITFKTLRHWKATLEYHRTKDIVHVMQFLGHKNIKNTLVYVHLAEEIFKGEQEYVSKVAKTTADTCALVEAGFEYVCDFNEAKIFRKPKW